MFGNPGRSHVPGHVQVMLSQYSPVIYSVFSSNLLSIIIILFHCSCGEGMCRPTVSIATAPYLRIVSGCHPCVVSTFSGGDFIPNDVMVNCEGGEGGGGCVVVVTGPNMGGKSTLMRQTGLIVILAHLVS